MEPNFSADLSGGIPHANPYRERFVFKASKLRRHSATQFWGLLPMLIPSDVERPNSARYFTWRRNVFL